MVTSVSLFLCSANVYCVSKSHDSLAVLLVAPKLPERDELSPFPWDISNPSDNRRSNSVLLLNDKQCDSEQLTGIELVSANADRQQVAITISVIGIRCFMLG